MSSPLDGIWVLDFTIAQQGPYATVMLSDMGAEVIKIEEPKRGDMGRYILGRIDNALGLNPYFLAHDRNKRSVTLDLKHPRAKEVVLRLVEHCDVLVQNFRPGVMQRLGLDYATLSQVNPRLIYASASGFGSKGPLAQKPGLDLAGQAMGGIMAATGPVDGRPHPVGVAIADQTGAMMLAYGIVLALFARERSGEGQEIDCSLLGTQIALQSWEITQHMTTGKLAGTGGQGHPLIQGLYQTFPTADGYLVIGGVTPDKWERFCVALGQEEGLMADGRFASGRLRVENRQALYAELSRLFASRPTADWIPLIESADVVCGPVRDYAGVAECEQAWANGYLDRLEHPEHGPVRVAGVPVSLSKTPGQPRSLPPELGEHTEAVLHELGYTWEEIAQLRIDGVI